MSFVTPNARIALILLCQLAAAIPAAAHHSHASLNREDVRIMNGVVTEFMWRSPHVYLQADVLREDGEIVNYTMEMGNPMSMGRSGWNKDTLQTGDRVTWQGAHDRDLERAYMSLQWVEVDGQDRLYASAAEQREYLASTGGELPGYLSRSGEPEPVTQIGEGMWTRVAADGGRFQNIYGPELILDWPLTDLARQRVENFTEADNPINECVFSGPPRAMLTLSNFKWSRSADTISIDRDLWPAQRMIHLDQNAPRGEPSRLGHSIGWFEGNELHVTTDNFIADTWAIYWGLDSSAQLTLNERYWLSEGGLRLNLEMTITDPVMLREPTVKTHQWRRIVDTDLIKAECSLENANFFLTAGFQ